MRLLFSAALGLVLFGSTCLAADDVPKERQIAASSAVNQVGKLAHHLSRTLSEITSDVLPVVKAVGEEAFREAHSDLPKIGAELKHQFRHLLPVKKGRD